MNRIDRLQAILIQLQGKRVVRAQEIADRFEISLRTVYRDIRALEEGGVPIGAEAGVGYFLLENYHLPPVMFTHEEASALLFGEKLMDKMTDEKTCKDFRSALFKIKAILKPGEKDHLEKLNDRIAVFNLNAMSERFDELYLFEIQQALANKLVLEIEYEPKYNTEAACRQVEPFGLINYGSRWHMFAWCKLRNDYRDFRLDRIVSLRVTAEHFRGKQHPTIEEYMKTISPFSDEPNITLLVPKERKKYIDDSKYWYGFAGETEEIDGFRMKFCNEELKGFATWLLSSACYPKIESPAQLQEIVQGYIRDAVEHYRYLL
jgi:predicted DNA-binding transcriptional regulator YafY